MTDWDDLNQRVSPGGSSGLAIISRFRFPGKQQITVGSPPQGAVPGDRADVLQAARSPHQAGRGESREEGGVQVLLSAECSVGNLESESELKWNERLLFLV